MARSTVTIRDVAAQAGVSHQTVSRVINGHERVSPETKARVESAILNLGFSPNAIARFMAKGATGTLACIAPNLTNYTFAGIIEGAQTEAREHGYYLLSASAQNEEIFASLIEELVNSRRTEGVMVINPYADGRYHHLPAGFPTVFAGARPREDAVDSVALDDESVGRLATQHLLDLGHRQIGMVTGIMSEDCAQDRLAGYEAALEGAGIMLRPEWIVAGNWQASSGYAAFQQFLQAGYPLTAIFAQNDQMAVGVLRAAREAGVKVPDQLSVIGVDDIPLTAYFEPPLTTLRQDFYAIGREAARLLIQAIKSPDQPRQHLRLPAGFIIRNSTTRNN